MESKIKTFLLIAIFTINLFFLWNSYNPSEEVKMDYDRKDLLESYNNKTNREADDEEYTNAIIDRPYYPDTIHLLRLVDGGFEKGNFIEQDENFFDIKEKTFYNKQNIISYK